MNELIIIQEHKELALAHLNSAGRNLIAFGAELNIIKDSLKHGEFGNWIKDNMPMNQQQCNKYMALAKSQLSLTSNYHSSGNLDINSEILLLAFAPEDREEIRETLKDSTQTEATAEIKRMKLALESTKDRAEKAENQIKLANENKEQWRAQSLSERDAKRELEIEVIELRNKKPIIQFVDDTDKVREEFKGKIEKLERELKAAYQDKINAITETRESLHGGYDKTINEKQRIESSLEARIQYLSREQDILENGVGELRDHRETQKKIRQSMLTISADFSMIFDDFKSLPDSTIPDWLRITEDLQKMTDYYRGIIIDKQGIKLVE